jgi:dTDP-4-amino-4,6-dideoxygalactose transaminase
MVSVLACNGGEPVRTKPFPPRGHFGTEEKESINKLITQCIADGSAPGYGGDYEKQYDLQFAEFLGGGFADGVNSGTNALFVALGALGLEPFSEIIVPPISDPGGVMPVVFIGCVPVPADSDKRTYNTSVEQIAPLINERTRAIVLAHIAGDPVDMDPVLKLAEKHNLYVVEDCAQAHGASYKGKPVGTLGHIAAFSTMFGKHHCTGGQGGVVFTKNEKLHWQGRRFADRGKPFNIENPTGNVTAGLNCNLSDLGAAIGSAQLKKLPDILQRRQKIAAKINEGLNNFKIVSPAWQVSDTQSAFWFMKIKFNQNECSTDKLSVCQALSAEGLPISPHYRHIPAEMPWFINQSVFGTSGFPWSCAEYKGSRKPTYSFPNAIAVTECHLNLHFNESFSSQDIEDCLKIFEKVESALRKR